MRPDQTDPALSTMKSRTDGVDREMSERLQRDADGAIPLPERMPRAGSPSPMAMGDGIATSWQDIKSQFVDDPAGAIAAAEELVRLAVEQRIRSLKDEAAAICARGRDQDASSTEDLRTRLIRYKEYCERLAETSMH